RDRSPAHRRGRREPARAAVPGAKARAPMKRGPARRLARAALAGLERLLLPGDGPFAWSPTFVQGAPRSGTTLVYQAIVARWRCSFFSNRERACAPYPLLAARLGRAAARFEPTFDSEFGAIRGRDAPSDGWEVFHRFFPYRFDPATPLVRPAVLRRTVLAFERLYGAPFAVKNNANSLRLVELGRVFPEAVFVTVRRDPLATVASLLRARAAHDVAPDRFWAAEIDDSLVDIELRDAVERSVYQTLFVDAFVTAVAAERPAAHLLLRFEDFVADPEGCLAAIAARRDAHGLPAWPERTPAADLRGAVRRPAPDVDPWLCRRIAAAERRVRDAAARDAWQAFDRIRDP